MDQRQQLVADLCRVRDLVRELDRHLHAPCSSSVHQCRRLAAEIVALTDRTIGAAAAATPPCSGAPSPLSDAGSDHNQQQPFLCGGSPKKRKATARWSGQVRVSSAATGAAAEGPADDGHSWRKYGQKDILGARHPRAYYRCTHRNSQGCPATKQVQRTDADPAVFDVVYHGEHTCKPAAARRTAQQQQHNPHAESLLQGLGARLTVDTDATTAINGAGVAVPPMTPESHPPRGGASSPWSLASPVGSDSNNNVYPCPVAGYGELHEVVSAFTAGSGCAHQTALDTAFMPPEYFDFDYQSFGIDAVDTMPSLFLQ